MATPVSTVDAARTAIYTALAAEVALTTSVPPTQVLLGPPATQNLTDDLVVVGERIQQRSQPHNLVGGGGTYWLLEEYTISVVVDVYRGGDRQSDAWSRCVALVAAVDDSIRADPSLGSTVGRAYPAGHDYTLDYNPDHVGWLARCVIEVMVSALP
jgi:hypothetical protein